MSQLALPTSRNEKIHISRYAKIENFRLENDLSSELMKNVAFCLQAIAGTRPREAREKWLVSAEIRGARNWFLFIIRVFLVGEKGGGRRPQSAVGTRDVPARRRFRSQE